jgi:hypothetical protein
VLTIAKAPRFKRISGAPGQDAIIAEVAEEVAVLDGAKVAVGFWVAVAVRVAVLPFMGVMVSMGGEVGSLVAVEVTVVVGLGTQEVNNRNTQRHVSHLAIFNPLYDLF